MDNEHRMNGVKKGNHKSGNREHINNLDFNVERNSESYKYVVRMSNAWFSYDGKAYVLKGINACVKREMKYVGQINTA